VFATKKKIDFKKKKKMKLFLVLLVLFFVSLLLFVTSTSGVFALKLRTDPPIIHGVECVGSVQGIWEIVSNQQTGEQRQVAKFMGIPFVGQQPVGQYRFKGPQPFSASDPICNPAAGTVYNATYYRSPCVQLDNYGEGPGIIGSEDCLYIEAIYVPEKIYDKVKTLPAGSVAYPVNLYYHGGSNIFGSGLNEKHGFLAAFFGNFLNHSDPDGAIFITTNYRLGLFGFLAAESFGTDVNFGIQDCIASAKWTKRNVAVFGGDVNRIQGSGQSSGGTNLFGMIAGYQIKGIFKTIVSMSGSPNITIDRNAKLAQDLPIVQQLGCASNSNNNASSQLTCLQALDYKTIMSSTPASWMTPTLCDEQNVKPTGKHYVGLPFVDGNIVVTSFKDALLQGMNGDVTLVISGMAQECNLFPNQPTAMINATDAQWKEYLNNVFFPEFPTAQREQLVSAVYSTYGPEMRVNTNLALFSLSADYGQNCANIYLANKTLFSTSSSSRTAPIYHSINRWQPSYPQNNGPWSYAFHLWDYISLTQTLWDELAPFEPAFKPGPSDFALSELLRSQWYYLMSYGSLENWSYPIAGVDVKWPPVNFDPARGVMSFVYSNADGPYSLSHSQFGLNADKCNMLRSFGFDERYWWCD
jgi:carboxylesterase type B